ncbi:Root cap [Musa troglodytarum]|uniref:Root cap n=1 Tax=Musa troglodytarum TaxID=320322 RepID=A0A9E7KV24_9LILI|nr:Root cap [Musa troglodytarum]
MRFTWLLFLALSSCFFCSVCAKPAKAYCKNPYFWRCYGVPHTCPPGCPKFCQVDCRICKPYCARDKPGAVCQDPRFIGRDGIMFYFHGRKDRDFCLVSDAGIHINGHFIGKNNRKEDFTGSSPSGSSFGRHLFVGEKASRWHDRRQHPHPTRRSGRRIRREARCRSLERGCDRAALRRRTTWRWKLRSAEIRRGWCRSPQRNLLRIDS